MFRGIILFACVVALTSCSRTELVYRNADWLAYRWVDRLLDADQAQRERWPLLFEQLMQAHRRELLPPVVALLQQASSRAQDGLSARDLDCLWQDANGLIESHARLIVPTALDVLSNVSAVQIEHLRAELEERNAEFREDYLNPDPRDREAARVERFTERIERWTGRLSIEQASQVEAAVHLMPDVTADWLRYRERQQQRLLAILRGKHPQALEDFLVSWWVDQADRGTVLDATYPQLRDAWIHLLAALDATLNERQRAHLLVRITDLRDDLAGEMDSEIDASARPHTTSTADGNSDRPGLEHKHTAPFHPDTGGIDAGLIPGLEDPRCAGGIDGKMP